MAKDVFQRYREKIELVKGLTKPQGDEESKLPTDGPVYGLDGAPVKTRTKATGSIQDKVDGTVNPDSSFAYRKEQNKLESNDGYVTRISSGPTYGLDGKPMTLTDDADSNIKICNYDKVVSLGFNCEVSFALKDYYGKLDSYPYSWCYSADRELMLSSLGHMEEILTGHVECLPESNMFKCHKFQLSFHAKSNRDQLEIDGVEQPEKVKESLMELRSRVGHLTDKMQALFNSKESTLFIYKLRFTNDWEEDNRFIIKLVEKLNELYKSHNFVLLVVVENVNRYKVTLKDNEQLKVRVIDNFSGFYNVQGSTDHAGWAKILDEFSHYKGHSEPIAQPKDASPIAEENPFFARSRDIIGF
ncbi:MAG: hypothetical protein ACI4DS_07620 [Eubacterium sp.]